MKINWGGGIALFYILFMTVLLFFVIKSTSHRHEMVTENYYQKDLDYQAHFDKTINAMDENLIEIELYPNENTINLLFLKEQAIEGKVKFYRPSDSTKDFTLDINLDHDNKMEIQTTKMISGPWTIQLDWVQNEETFFKEMKIII